MMDICDLIVLNESRHEDSAGDVTLFASLAALASHVEPIDVVNDEYFAYTLAGERLLLKVEDGDVRVVRENDLGGDASRVRGLLEETADFVRAARLSRGDRRMEALDPKSMSIEELVELIGISGA